ncbi:MAG: DnaA/Hda family protein [Pseudomonadota bacterium]
MRHPQRALHLGTPDWPTLASFVPGNNLELLQRLADDGPGFRVLWLYADDCLGKTHVLKSVAGHGGYRSARLGIDALRFSDALPPTIAVDDVAWIIGDRGREEALLALYQRCFDARVRLLVASRCPVRALAPLLPDLASRLRAFEVFALAPPDDSGRRAILRRLALRRGVPLDEEVIDFWLLRSHRSLRSLTEALELVVDFALGARRPITVPLLKEALDW